MSNNFLDKTSAFAQDSTKPKTNTFRQPFTTAQVRIDVGQRMGLMYIRAVIDNQDPANNVTVRTEPSGDLITIPPNSVGEIVEEIHTFIEINPDAVAGNGLLTLTLADPDELRAKGLLG